MWVEPPEYRGILVSDTGQVVTLRRGTWHELRQYRTDKGYLKVEIYIPSRPKTKRFVHRLIMQAFCGASTLQVNHIDGDKENNRLDNLEYVTNRQNSLHYQANKAKYRESFKSKYFIHRK